MRYVIALAALLLAGPAAPLTGKCTAAPKVIRFVSMDAAGIDRTPEGNLRI